MKEIVQLLGDRVGLEILIRRKWGSGLIVTPPGIEKKTDEAIVRYLGEGYKGFLSVGDRVIYDRHSTQEIFLGEKPLYITNSAHLLAQVIPDE